MQTKVDAPTQLLIDLSQLVREDAKSGIQRVVRSMFKALSESPPAGYEVTAVYDAGGYYAYARSYGAATVEYAAEPAEQTAAQPDPIRVRRDDLFFGLDLCPDQIPRNEAVLSDLRRHGVKLYFMVYDLVPLSHPAMFHPSMAPWFARWLATVSRQADGLICISRAVADELAERLEEQPPRRASPLQIGYCHLGADLQASVPSSGSSAEDQAVLERLGSRATLLMVGTLEPRKMHSQALDALELLWQRGGDANLVVVGKRGWEVAQLEARLRAHPELGHRLFWLERASDDILLQLYQRSAALLAASAAEGFGLPLIEAAQYSLPVIARDLPVFREVAGAHAYYFNATDGVQLADALEHWLQLYAHAAVPSSSAMPYLSWQGSTAQLRDVMLDRQWYRTGTIALE